MGDENLVMAQLALMLKKIDALTETVAEHGATLESLTTAHRNEEARRKGKAMDNTLVKLSMEELSEVEVLISLKLP